MTRKLSRRDIGTLKLPDLRSRMQRQLAEERAALFAKLCRREGIPEPVREHQFAAPDRKWAFDYAWPGSLVALECDGGVWSNGRHVRGSGFLRDVEKLNAAAVRGWLVFRCTPKTLDTLETVHLIKRALAL